MRECLHWLDVSISVARRLRLFEHSTDDKINLSPEKRLLKRIGWACFMQDCLISLASRRQPIIQKSYFQLECLKEEDFNAVESFGVCSQKDLAIQKVLILICVATAQLCICIHTILEVQGNGNDHIRSTGSNEDVAPSSQSKTSHPDNILLMLMFDINLTSWAHSLPTSCKHRRPSSKKYDGIENSDFVTFVQRCVLHMTFCTAVSVLHQSKMFVSSEGRIYDAAFQITKIASAVHARELNDFLPSPGVTAILVAAIIHISDMQISSFPRQQRDRAAKNLQSCIEVMTGLQEMFPTVKIAISKMTNMVPNTTSARSPFWEDRDSTPIDFGSRNYGFDSCYSIGCEVPMTRVLPFGFRHTFLDGFGDTVVTGLEWNFEDYTTLSTRSLSCMDPLFGSTRNSMDQTHQISSFSGAFEDGSWPEVLVDVASFNLC